MSDWPAANFICDWSGFKLKQTESVREWDNAMVGRKFVDRRNPQDFVRGAPDRQDLPWTRPEVPDQFITDPVTPEDL